MKALLKTLDIYPKLYTLKDKQLEPVLRPIHASRTQSSTLGDLDYYVGSLVTHIASPCRNGYLRTTPSLTRITQVES